jgi:hypothetical protein
MQVTEERIRNRKTSATTQRLQQQVIDELAKLVEQARKAKCSGGQPSQNPAGGADRKQVDQGQGTPNAQGKQPAEDSRGVRSTERLGQAEAAEARLVRRRALLKQLWGHLPQRVRERMPNTGAEEFLPKYADIIEDYFERLADPDRDQR